MISRNELRRGRRKRQYRLDKKNTHRKSVDKPNSDA